MIQIQRHSPIFRLYERAYLLDRGWLDGCVTFSGYHGSEDPQYARDFGAYLREVKTYRRTKARYERKPYETCTVLQTKRLEHRRRVAAEAINTHRERVQARYSRRRAYRLEQSLLRPHSFCPYFWAVLGALVWYLPVVRGSSLVFSLLRFLLAPVFWALEKSIGLIGRHSRVALAIPAVALAIWAAPAIKEVAVWGYNLPHAIVQSVAEHRAEAAAERYETERLKAIEALDQAELAQSRQQAAQAAMQWEREHPDEVAEQRNRAAWDHFEQRAWQLADRLKADQRARMEREATLEVWVPVVGWTLAVSVLLFAAAYGIERLYRRFENVRIPVPTFSFRLPAWMTRAWAAFVAGVAWTVGLLAGLLDLFVTMAKAVHDRTCPLQVLEPEPDPAS